MMRVGYRGKRVHYPAVNWVLACIAHPLEQCCFTSICPPDNNDMEVGVLGSDFHSFCSFCSSCNFRLSHYPCYSRCWIKFEQLGGIPCNPLPNIFFRQSQNPLEALAACGGHRSVISMRGGDKKGLRLVIHEACHKPELKGIYRTS